MSDDEEDYTFYGSAVEHLDEGNIGARKAPRLEDQMVTDKQGRRRFHGAFTGGFSAGHFNSVGSVEGFTPAAFTSSRSGRHKNVQQTTTMFMDDEDMDDHGIAPQKLQAAEDFSAGLSSSALKRKRQFPQTGPIPGTPALLHIVSVTSCSIGVQMLKSLGWKEGQGIGPRLSAKEKKRRCKLMRQRAKERTLQSESESDSELPDQYSRVTLAPDDVNISAIYGLSYLKTNTFGLGYIPLSRENVLGRRADEREGTSNMFSVNSNDKKKSLKIKGQAFGVGAFEEDDEDIYAQEDMSHYDFVLGGNRSKNDDSSSSHLNALQGVDQLSCALNDFVISSTPLIRRSPPPLPVLPANFTPKHVPHKRRFSSKPHELAGIGRNDLTHADRQRILSGTSEPQPSVEIRFGVKGASIEPTPLSSSATEEDNKDQSSNAVEHECSSASATTDSPLGFKPFASDSSKQQRYDLYLRMKEKGMKSRYKETQPPSLTEWEKSREEREFERASQLYKPLTFTMATRFVTSSVSDGEPVLKEGLNMSIKKTPAVPMLKTELTADFEGLSSVSAAGGASTESDCITTIKPKENSDPRLNAAWSSMFGKLTQANEEWHPCSVLCKRFNVPNPYPGNKSIGVVTSKSNRGNLFSELLSDAPTKTEADIGQPMRPYPDVTTDPTKDSSLHQITAALDQQQTEGALEDYGLKVSVSGPPTKDLFKAIFEDSSSDSDSNDISDISVTEATEPLGNAIMTSIEGAVQHRNPPLNQDKTDDQTFASSHSVSVGSEGLKHVFRSRKTDKKNDRDSSSSSKSKKKENKNRKDKVIKSSLSFLVESHSSDSDCQFQTDRRMKSSHKSSSVISNCNSENNAKSNIFQYSEKSQKDVNVNKPTKTTHSSSNKASGSYSSTKIKEELDHSSVNDLSNSQNPRLFITSPEGNRKCSAASNTMNTKSTASSASGIFSNIDFSELNRYRDLMESDAFNDNSKEQFQSSNTRRTNNEDSTEDSNEDTFGPALPPNFVNPLQEIKKKKSNVIVKQDTSDRSKAKNWVEVTKKSHTEKKMKSKKKARKKGKSKKHKEKKKRRHETSSSNDSSSSN